MSDQIRIGQVKVMARTRKDLPGLFKVPGRIGKIRLRSMSRQVKSAQVKVWANQVLSMPGQVKY